MAAVPRFGNDLVAVTSHVKTLYLEKQIDQKGPARTTLPRHLLI